MPEPIGPPESNRRFGVDSRTASLTRIRKGIEDQDVAAFTKAYTDTLVGCMACHLAAEKPYLRLRVPEAPEARLIEFPVATPGR